MGRPPRRLPPIRSAVLVGRLLPRRDDAPSCAYCRWSGGAPRSIVALGDLQRTVLAEQLYLGRRQNDAVREALIRAVAEESPDAIVLLGDQVADGASDREWHYFDALMEELRERRTAIHAIPGNHDYSRFDRARSIVNFCGRFGWTAPGVPDVARFGPIAYIGLDSNFGVIGPDRTREEGEMLRRTLEELDGDPTVRGVIVASHHPPFTNSRLPGTARIAELFAEPFLAARKTRLFLSAHVHSYERFESNGRMFVVSGGGGGPRRRVDVSEARRCRNDVFRGEPVRPFHYLRIRLEENAIAVETMMLMAQVRRWQRRWEGPTPTFVVGDAFRLELEPEPSR